MKQGLSEVAQKIRMGELINQPLVFGVTGTGRVAKGALEVLKDIPHEIVDPLDLGEFLNKNKNNP